MTLARALAVFLAATVFMAVGVQLAARGAWALSGAGRTNVQELRAQPSTFHRVTAEDLDKVRIHHVSEWPADRPRIFQESPLLAARVAAGEIPPVEQRLPEEPLVVTPPEQCGPYGGDWVRCDTETTRYITFRIGYEDLVRFDPFARSVLPNVLKKWEVSDDGQTFTLYMRKGIRWSDGSPHTAEDYVFWHDDIIMDPNVTPVLPESCRVGGKPFELQKLDDYTVRIHFAGPNGLFMQTLGSGSFHGSPSRYLKRFHPRYGDPDDINRLVVKYGMAGPYQLFDRQKATWANSEIPQLDAWVMAEEYTPGKPTVFVRNPYYWKVDPQGNQLPYIDRIVCYVVSDKQTLYLKAMKGELSMHPKLELPSYPLLVAKSLESRRPDSHITPFRVLNWFGPACPRLIPNLNHPDPVKNALFNDVRFRRALSLAINRREINEIQFLGLGLERQNAPTPRSPFYSAHAEQAYTAYDPVQASRLLDELGLTQRDADGFRLRPDGKTLVVDVNSSTLTGYEDALHLVSRFWREIGIKSDLRIQAHTLWRERYWSGLQDVYAWFFGGEQDPLNGDGLLPSDRYDWQARLWGLWYETEGAKGERPSPEMVEAMELMRTIQKTPDRAEQIRLCRRILDIRADNVWEIGVVSDAPLVTVVQDRFRNVPTTAYYDWYSRGPGNTAPECYAIQPE